MDITWSGAKTLASIADKHKGVVNFTTPSGIQEMWYVDEAGLYRLIMRSNKDEAERFQDWIAEEVLPSIRRHGAYMTPDTLDKMISSPEFGIKLLTALQEERTRREMAEAQLMITAPKAQSWEIVGEDEGLVWDAREAAKLASLPGLNETYIRELARGNGWLCLDGTPTAKAIRDGYCRSIVKIVGGGNYRKPVTVTMYRPKAVDMLVRQYRRESGGVFNNAQ